MQIILVQSEVESAIRAYVASQLTLAEGTDIQIDLSATRGADGIKATIDIVPAGTARPVAVAPAPAPAVVVKAEPARQTPNTALASAQATLAAATGQKTQDAPTEQAAEVPVTQEQSQEAAGEAQTSPQAQEAAAPPAEAAPTKSLFGGLNRPKNN